jgi:hypothetical protein
LGGRFPVGGEVRGVVVLEECTRFYSGTVVSNGEASDKLSYPTRASTICAGGEALRSGTLTWVATNKGVLTVTSVPRFVIEFPGFCAYEVSKLVGTFKPGPLGEPGPLATRGTAAGKLDKTVSLGEACPATKPINFVAEGKEQSEGSLYTELE